MRYFWRKNTMKLTIASYEETAERYKNAKFLVFSPKTSKDFIEKPPKDKAGKKEELSRKESNKK